ncbi:MAG: tRNA 4-thiouridine(8) synthase ThiI [bacterium]|nr:tRNA 4-thiouridine(8) synthase ThiI [bacterium]
MGRGKGIVLYSGGLDSLLAAKVLMEQELDVVGFHCILPFVAPDFDPEELDSSKLARDIGLPLIFYRCGKEYLEIVKNPPHGYGKNMNPCIDCKIHFIKKAAEYMKQENADFIATGEVVGQRPMSQLKNTLNHIINETGLGGRLLRPLSAKILSPTIPEEEGIVDRELLYNISGRSRKEQMKLAKKLGITRYASPAGGCLFTDPMSAKRVKDLVDYHRDDCTVLDLYLLTVGRNFRINDSTKIIVSRKEFETNELEKYKKEADYFFYPSFKGPNIFTKGELTSDEILLVGTILAKYGKPEENQREITVYKKGSEFQKIEAGAPIETEELEKMKI